MDAVVAPISEVEDYGMKSGVRKPDRDVSREVLMVGVEQISWNACKPAISH